MAHEELHLNLRNLRLDDYDQLQKLMDRVYDDIGGSWPKDTIKALVEQFPDGQICIEESGQLIAVALTVCVKYERFSNPHTYDDLILRNEKIWHNANGDSLYGLDVFIHPDYRGYRLGRRLYEARKELCRSMNLRAILAGRTVFTRRVHSTGRSEGNLRSDSEFPALERFPGYAVDAQIPARG